MVDLEEFGGRIVSVSVLPILQTTSQFPSRARGWVPFTSFVNTSTGIHKTLVIFPQGAVDDEGLGG